MSLIWDICLLVADISKFNTENVIDMSGIFFNCSSLKSLPDISKWNTKNVKFIDDIFYNCNSLKSLSVISKLKEKIINENSNINFDKYLLKGNNKLITLRIGTISRFGFNDFFECKSNELFSRVVSKILDKYPKYKDKNFFFMNKLENIDLSLTVEQNGCKSGDFIIMEFIDY